MEHLNAVAGLSIVTFLAFLAVGIVWLNERGHKKDRH